MNYVQERDQLNLSPHKHRPTAWAIVKKNQLAIPTVCALFYSACFIVFRMIKIHIFPPYLRFPSTSPEERNNWATRRLIGVVTGVSKYRSPSSWSCSHPCVTLKINFRNVGKYSPTDTSSHPRTLECSTKPKSGTGRISQRCVTFGKPDEFGVHRPCILWLKSSSELHRTVFSSFTFFLCSCKPFCITPESLWDSLHRDVVLHNGKLQTFAS